MLAVFRELDRRGVPVSRLDALELFGGDGSRHTLDYYPLVQSVEIWEVDGAYEPEIRRNLPGARIKITDSFQELHRSQHTFELIVVDSPGGLFGPEMQYCEHMEAFTPALFRLARKSAVLILSVFPDLRGMKSCSPEHRQRLQRRSEFYCAADPEYVDIDQMMPVYRSIANSAGFEVNWHFSLRRTRRSKVYYLAMNVTCN